MIVFYYRRDNLNTKSFVCVHILTALVINSFAVLIDFLSPCLHSIYSKIRAYLHVIVIIHLNDFKCPHLCATPKIRREMLAVCSNSTRESLLFLNELNLQRPPHCVGLCMYLCPSFRQTFVSEFVCIYRLFV